VLPFGRLRYGGPDNAIGYAMHRSRSHDAVIRVYGDVGDVIETHEHGGQFRQQTLGAKGKAQRNRKFPENELLLNYSSLSTRLRETR